MKYFLYIYALDEHVQEKSISLCIFSDPDLHDYIEMWNAYNMSQTHKKTIINVPENNMLNLYISYSNDTIWPIHSRNSEIGISHWSKYTCNFISLIFNVYNESVPDKNF